MAKILNASISTKKGGISYFTGFVNEVVLIEDGTSSFKLSLWQVEDKRPVFVFSGFDERSDEYVGAELSAENVDKLCEELQKAKTLLLESEA